jgi:hypothetical protein
VATFIEQLASNPNALVTLTVPRYAQTAYGLPTTIQGLIEADFGFDISSEYSQDDDGMSASLRSITAALSKAQSIQKTVQQTLKYWNGSGCPVFTVPITLVKLQQNTDVISLAKILLGGVVPVYQDIRSMAPYGYTTPATFSIQTISKALDSWSSTGSLSSVGSAIMNTVSHQEMISSIQNTWTLQYAQWFCANSLVLQNVSFMASKENAKGTFDPYMVKLALTFTTAYTPDRDTVMSWFISGNTNYLTARSTDSANAPNFGLF